MIPNFASITPILAHYSLPDIANQHRYYLRAKKIGHRISNDSLIKLQNLPIISVREIPQHTEGGVKMITVEKLLDIKGHEVWSVSPEDSVYDTIKIMDEKHVGALAVMNNDELVGIISERDYARQVILKDRTSRGTKVKEIMTRQVFYTYPSQTIDECLVIINERRIRHLPVLDDSKMVGMISVGDVVKEIIREQQYTIEQLENHLSWAESY